MIDTFSHIEFDDKGDPLPENQSPSRDLFKKLKIGQDEATMTQHLAQHPVIYFDMAFQIDGEITKDKILRAYSAKLNDTYSRYRWIIEEHSFDPEIAIYKAEQHTVRKAATEVLAEYEIKDGILHVATLLKIYFNKSPVLLIDNYDAIVHDSFIDSKGCLDPVYSTLEEILFKCYQHNPQVIEYTMIASTTTIGFQCFGLHRLFEQFCFYDSHKFTSYFGLSDAELDDLNGKYNQDRSAIPTILKYCGGYEIKNTNQTISNTSCVIDYLETNDNSTWISQQIPSEPTRFLWKLLKIPEYLEQISRLIKNSPIRHGRHDFISFTNFTKIVFDDFDETKFFSGVNSSIFSYLIQTGLLTPVPGRISYIMPNLQIRNLFKTDLFYYYEKIAEIDLKTIGIRLGEFFNPDKNYASPKTNLIECLTPAFAGLKPIHNPNDRNFSKSSQGRLEFIYQSIIHMAGLTNDQIRVIEDFPQPISYEKSSVNVIRRSVTCIEKDDVALIIKTTDQYDLETLMTNGHKYDIEQREDLDLVVYLAIRIEPDKRVLIDVMTSQYTDEISGNTTYHYITSFPKKTKPTKAKRCKADLEYQRTTSDWD